GPEPSPVTAAGVLSDAASAAQPTTPATSEPSGVPPSPMPQVASIPTPVPGPVSDEPMPPARVTWMGRVGALGLLAVIPASLVTFGENSTTGWNAFAVFSPIEGFLAAVAVWLLIDLLRRGRVPASVGAGALLVIGASEAVSALGLAAFAGDWVPSAVPVVVVVVAGGLLTFAAGVDCLRTALPTPKSGAIGIEPLALGGAGVAAAFVGLFLNYDGESSLVSELEEIGEYFYSAAFACLLALGALLAVRGWPRLASGALLASGGVLAVHYLGIVLASASAIGEPGDTRAGAFIGILGGLLVAAAGAYAYTAVRPKDDMHRFGA
ncbi:MAG TPA: hypothetical protein VF062_09645, partial [Candidatus Limnocylindrales bacterium]